MQTRLARRKSYRQINECARRPIAESFYIPEVRGDCASVPSVAPLDYEVELSQS